MGDVTQFNVERADRLDDNTLVCPEEVLLDAAHEIRTGKVACTSVLVLMLDATGDRYNVGYYASHLRSSEQIALVEVFKTKVLMGMGYIPEAW